MRSTKPQTTIKIFSKIRPENLKKSQKKVPWHLPRFFFISFLIFKRPLVPCGPQATGPQPQPQPQPHAAQAQCAGGGGPPRSAQHINAGFISYIRHEPGALGGKCLGVPAWPCCGGEGVTCMVHAPTHSALQHPLLCKPCQCCQY
jgi:hypothetical protein